MKINTSKENYEHSTAWLFILLIVLVIATIFGPTEFGGYYIICLVIIFSAKCIIWALIYQFSILIKTLEDK